jgi:hypothetical protein
MILHCALRSAIIARDHSSGVSELLWHRLRLDSSIKVAELRFHIHDSLLAYWALIRCLQMCVIAVPVNGMSASHEHYCLRRCEHILMADGTVAVARPLNAFVTFFHGDIHTEPARLCGMLDFRMR